MRIPVCNVAIYILKVDYCCTILQCGVKEVRRYVEIPRKVLSETKNYMGPGINSGVLMTCPVHPMNIAAKSFGNIIETS